MKRTMIIGFGLAILILGAAVASGSTQTEFTPPTPELTRQLDAFESKLMAHETAISECMAEAGTRWDVYAVATEAMLNAGDWLCRYGRTTGNHCARVDAFGVSYPPSISWAFNLVAMDRVTSDDGDSGGPWFDGTTAHGIHSGIWLGGDLFTPVFRVSNEWSGMTVKH